MQSTKNKCAYTESLKIFYKCKWGKYITENIFHYVTDKYD